MGKRDSEKIKKKLDAGGIKEMRMVTVTDDWFPCYSDNQVNVTICVSRGFEHKDTYYVRISAWGADDTGVEMHYQAGKYCETAYAIYRHWKEYIFDRIPDGVDMKWFYEHGFYPG